MFVVYILQSTGEGRYYIGHTKDLDKRLQEHNQGRVRSTKAHKPWRVIYVEQADGKQKAYKREMQIKSFKNGEGFKKLIQKVV